MRHRADPLPGLARRLAAPLVAITASRCVTPPCCAQLNASVRCSRSAGDGADEGLFYREAEIQLATLAQVGRMGGDGARLTTARSWSLDPPQPPRPGPESAPVLIVQYPLQYYDIPSPSLRDAVYPEMLADWPPFKVLTLPGPLSAAGRA